MVLCTEKTKMVIHSIISWKGNLVPCLSAIVSLSVLNNFELCYRDTGTSWSRGGSVIAAVFLAHNYVSEQFGNYVEYGSNNVNNTVVHSKHRQLCHTL